MRQIFKASYDNEVSVREFENRKVAYRAACEGMVLLKNDGTLPLDTKKVALYGSGASRTIKGGTGSGEVNERYSVTILDGLKERGFQIVTQNWLDDYELRYSQAKKEYAREKIKRVNIFRPASINEMLMDDFRPPVGRAITDEDVSAGQTDACIYVVSRQAGEGGDRKAEKGDMVLTDEEVASIRFCAEHYSKFVLVINAGCSVDMAFADAISGINSILYICQPGTEGGNAFADIVSGKVTPSGKLSDTWAKRYSDIPFAHDFSYLNGNLKDEYYREGIYVGYRYFDTFCVEPAYPFGFGLSYTFFDLQCIGVSAQGPNISIQTKVTNTGEKYAGKEVAQLYLSAPRGGMEKEYQSLVSFGKTGILKPGESEICTLSFDLTKFASYREKDACFMLEKGEYILRLGNSSRHTEVIGVLKLDQDKIVSRHENICPVQTPFKQLTLETGPQKVDYSDVPNISLDLDSLPTIIHSYEAPNICEDVGVNAFMRGLTLKQMVDIVVGVGIFGGTPRFNLPGSVGNTTSKFWDKGLVNVALCDGPAGLRIQKRSTIGKNGRIKPVEMVMSVYDAIPAFLKKFITGNPQKLPVLHQYTTAFPVTNALAQTWNQSLMTEVGHAVYREMKEYGCTFWLAPAVNIHRNPLCGRNFEYYSEDPYLTGAMATAVIRGVQCEDGFYVTVKHFSCNNQEDNRNYVSSNVSERALREIYLRAFEHTICEGGAKAVMTSYNKINGVYAPNSYDLCTKVLRNEWGFDGVVMTDWFSTGGRKADNALTMKAGNDLIMPGGASFKRGILKGVKSGRISEADVRKCCANVVKAIMHSATQREYLG